MKQEVFQKSLDRLIYLISFLPGLFLLFLYRAGIHFNLYPNYLSLIEYSKLQSLATAIASYAVTSMGFIVAVAALGVALPQTKKVHMYFGYGFFDIYIKLVKIDVFYLFINLILSIYILISQCGFQVILPLILILFINSLVINFISIIILLNLLHHGNN